MKKTEKELLRELKISAKKAKLNKIMQKYINHILIFIAVAIFLMFASTIYSVISKRKQKIYSEKLYSAIESLQKNDLYKGMEMLDKIYNDKKAPKSVKAISGIKLARLNLLINNNDEAIKIYKEIYKNNSKSSFIKYLAGNSAVTLLINQQDEQKYSEIEELLNKLIKDKKNPLINLTMEQKGIFEIQKGNSKQGIDILNSILLKSDLDSNARERINIIIKSYQE